MVVNIAGMSLKKQASRGGQHHRNRWSRWIRIGGQDGSEYTEVKATELHPRSAVMRSSELLQEDLRTSIIKAYKQLLSTANIIDKDKTWYGIIITYKEMYLGFGIDAWEEFLKAPIELFASQNQIELKVLPPENLFFLSITDWDWVVQALKDRKAPSLMDLLNKGKECNMSKDPLTQVFMMEQVLKKYFYVPKLSLSYLENAHQLLNIL